MIKQAKIIILAGQLFFPGGFAGFPPKFAENVIQSVDANLGKSLIKVVPYERNISD